MIWTVILVGWQRLRNNRSELFLTFIVPIVFFSIFAVIFGSRDSASKTPRVKIALSNPASSPLSNRAIELLAEQKSLLITDRSSSSSSHRSNSQSATESDSKIESSNQKPIGTVDPETAEDLVRRGMVSASVIFAESDPKSPPEIQVMTDSFDQVASQVLIAIVQQAVMTASGELAEAQARAARDANPRPPNTAPNGTALAEAPIITPPASQEPSAMAPVFKSVDVLGGKKTNPVIAMYAAGIAVMFLLFSATTASGSLLEERESSTLDRLLCSRLTMDQLLMGKWVYLTIIGTLQMTLMFVWGSFVFGIELVRHLEGFVALTLVTAGAASSFALLLASMCKSRMQLGWISTIVILSMSALGGSMVPRYLMSESIQRVGYATFNAWALEGYQKVFWRDLPLADVSKELAVLTASGFVFIVVARVFAIRWERA